MGIQLGTVIESADGVVLGSVLAIEQDYFQVMPDSGQLYWLSFSTLDPSERGTPVGESGGPTASAVALRFSAEEIQRQKVRPPAEQAAIAEREDKLTSGAAPLEGDPEAAESAVFGGRAAAEASGAWNARESEEHGEDEAKEKPRTAAD